MQVCMCRITVAKLMNKSDHDLFCKLCAPTHALNHLLPPTRNRASLRTRGHSYQLPEYSSDLHKKSSLIHSLYSFVKWNSFFWFCCSILYVILTSLFVFVVWCAFIASNKYYIHTYQIWHSNNYSSTTHQDAVWQISRYDFQEFPGNVMTTVH